MLRIAGWIFAASLALSACGGTVGSSSGGGASGAGGSPAGVTSSAGGSASAGGAGGTAVTGGTTASGGAQAGTGGYPPHPPAIHRANADPCSEASVPDAPPFVPNCATDADCAGTYRPGGRCVAGGCSYDCTSDRDCAPGVCLCNGAPGGDHICTWATCHVDADCPGSYCSPTLGICGSRNGVIAYRCHTPEDECTDDSDCGALGTPGYCMYDELVGHWNCHNSQCAG